MKVQTNLSPSELRKVGIGLQKLADSQQRNEIELENAAERALVAKAEEVFDVMVANLQQEVERILTDKEV